MRAQICLNMIVKNESRVIERCLRAVAPYISTFAILDTGSTDDTIAIIERTMKALGIQGVIGRSTFVDFQTTRNEAIALALPQKDWQWLLFVDADMVWSVTDSKFHEKLTEPVYKVSMRSESSQLEYSVIRLVRRDVPVGYKGVTHEYPECGAFGFGVLLPGAHVIDMSDGGCRADKLPRDVRLLKQGLANDPNNTRYMFYLANTYFDMLDYARAAKYYRKRIQDAGGYEEERFYSSYRLARCLQHLGREAPFQQQSLTTYQYWPTRAEPLYGLAQFFLAKGWHRLAAMIGETALKIPCPRDALFVEPDVYAWRIKDVLSVALHYLGNFRDAYSMASSILAVVPPGSDRARIDANRKLSFDMLSPATATSASPRPAQMATVVKKPRKVRREKSKAKAAK